MTDPSDDLLQSWRTILSHLDHEALVSLRAELTRHHSSHPLLLGAVEAELNRRQPQPEEE